MIEFEAPDWHALHSSLGRRRRFAFCPVGYYLYHVPGRDGYNNHPDDWHWQLYCAKHAVRADGYGRRIFRKLLRRYFEPGADFRRRKFDNFIRHGWEQEFALLESNVAASDPKLVDTLIEGDREDFSLYNFYDQVCFELDQMITAFRTGGCFEDLQKQPLIAFRSTSDSFRWQLGGVNFSAVPDLVWTQDNQLHVLDMNSYDYEEERIRQAELFRVYIYSFMHIALSAVQIDHFDLQKLIWSVVPASGEDFTKVFHQLHGEAVMMRDYLEKQSRCARQGEWLYAQLDKCEFCRFRSLCPARSGTVEEINRSIITREDLI